MKSVDRYGFFSIGLHWLMLLLLAAVYACIELREFFPKGSDAREALKAWHFMLGLSVFVLAWLRLVVHVTGPVPGITPEPGRWQKLSAKLMHAALYVLGECFRAGTEAVPGTRCLRRKRPAFPWIPSPHLP